MASKKMSVLIVDPSGPVNSFVYLNDKTLAILNGKGDIVLWDVATAKKQGTLNGPAHKVNSMTVTPDGKTLISGSDDQTIKLWDMDAKKEITSSAKVKGVVVCVAVSSDGLKVASAEGFPEERTIKLWDIPVRKQAGK